MVDAVAAAKCLYEAWKHDRPIPRLPDGCRPGDFAESYEIQSAMNALMGSVVAWKVGSPGPDQEPMYAPIYAERYFDGRTRLSSRALPRRLAEVEAGYRILDDIGPAQTGRDSLVALTEFVPTIEILSSRFIDMTKLPLPELLADGTGNGALVVGTGGPAAKSYDYRTAVVEITIDGNVLPAPKHNSDPLLLVAWLADHLCKRGGGLRKGQVVTTGSMIKPAPLAKKVAADWGSLGRVEAILTDD